MKHLITSLAMAMTLVSTAHAESLQYTVEPSSGSTVKAGTTVNINFLAPDGSALDSDGVETTDNYNVTLTGTETSVELSGSLSNNYSTLTFGLPENLAAGDYTISIPEGKFYGYSNKNAISPAIDLLYTISGTSSSIDVLSVSSDSLTNSIYDISGRRIESNQMGAGIYIVNGKKIVVR